MKPEREGTIIKLSTSDLSVGYGGKPLISGIELSLGEGEILTLIGPNGAGKSTILKSLTRHLATVAGTVFIDGKDIRRYGGREIAKKLAVVLTERTAPEMMTCFELAATGRYPYTGGFGMLTPDDKKAVTDALERVNAADIADRDVNAISDGQRQRVMLARAIAQDPEIIVLDEPTSFLDIKHKIELLEILNSMAKERRITVVMSLHEIELAERISDRLICVKGERIAAYGTPQEIFASDTVTRLYGIERGSFNPLLGNAELSKPCGQPRCFCVGGGGKGIPFYRALAKHGIAFAAGILLGNDLDLAVASPLAAKVVAAAAFSPVGEREKSEALDLMRASEFVVDCGAPSGELNAVNAELLKTAADEGMKIITKVEDITEMMK